MTEALKTGKVGGGEGRGGISRKKWWGWSELFLMCVWKGGVADRRPENCINGGKGRGLVYLEKSGGAAHPGAPAPRGLHMSNYICNTSVYPTHALHV